MIRLTEAFAVIRLAVVMVIVVEVFAYAFGAVLGTVAAGFQSFCGC